MDFIGSGLVCLHQSVLSRGCPMTLHAPVMSKSCWLRGGARGIRRGYLLLAVLLERENQLFCLTGLSFSNGSTMGPRINCLFGQRGARSFERGSVPITCHRNSIFCIGNHLLYLHFDQALA